MGLLSNLLNVIALVIFLFADIFADAKYARTGLELLTSSSSELGHPFAPWLVVIGAVGGFLLNILFWKNHSLVKRSFRIVFTLLSSVFFIICLCNAELALNNFRYCFPVLCLLSLRTIIWRNWILVIMKSREYSLLFIPLRVHQIILGYLLVEFLCLFGIYLFNEFGRYTSPDTSRLDYGIA